MATATYIASPLESFRLAVSDELHDQEVSLKRFKLTAGHRAANKRKSAAMGAPPQAQTKRTLRSAAVSGASPCQVPASDRASGRKCRLGALFPSPSMPRKDGPKPRPRAADVRSPETLNVPCASHDSPNHVHDIVLAQTASVEDLKSGCSTPKPTDAEQDGRPADEAADTPGLELLPGVAESEADAAGTDLLMERQARIAMLQSRMGDLLAARNDFAATDTRQRIVVQRRAPSQRSRPCEPTRQSARHRDKPAPRYCEVLPAPRAAPRGAPRASRVPTGAAAGSGPEWRWVCTRDPCLRTDSKVWYQSDPDTSADAQVEAANAAVACTRELAEGGAQMAAAVKMTWSKVDSGFWLSLPTHLVHDMQSAWGIRRFDNKDAWKMPAVPVTVVLGALEEEFVDPDISDSLNGTVVFLPRCGVTAGLSGGWRQVSINQKLQTNDWVVFEVVDGRPAEERAVPDRQAIEDNISIRMHVFRARHYDSQFLGADAEPYGRLRWDRTCGGADAGGEESEVAEEAAVDEQMDQENECAAANDVCGTA